MMKEGNPMKKMKKSLVSVLAILIMVSMLAACGGTAAQTPAATTAAAPAATTAVPAAPAPDATAKAPDTSPKTITVGTLTMPSDFDMLDDGTSIAMQLVFEGLYMPNPYTGKVEPVLAESYQVIDTMTTKIKLRDNVYFANGDKMTAADVMFSYSRFMDPNLNSPQQQMYMIFDFEKSTIQDDLNLTFVTKQPVGDIMTYLSKNPNIVSKKWYESAKPEELWNKSCGTGPYEVVENVSGSHTTLKLRSDYWNKDMMPEVATYIIKGYSEISTMLIDFQKGALNVITDLDDGSYKRLQGGEVKGATVKSILERENWYLVIPEYNEAFKDIRVREAIATGIDWKAVNEMVMGSLSIVPTSNLAASVAPYYKNEGAYEYNPEKAKQLIKEAGYEGKIVLNVVAPNPPMYSNFFEAIQAYLADLGIDMKFQSLDFGSAMPKIVTGQTDFFLMGSTGVAVNDPWLLMQHANTTTPLLPAKITDKEYNEKWDAASKLTDEKARIEAYNWIQDWLHANYWHIPVMTLLNAYAFDTNVKDWAFVSGRAPELRYLDVN